MNADAYLRKHGWKGSGHSLDSTGRGIKKPLLIAHKQDQLGLGQKLAAHRTDDQWWMRAFDESLKTIGSGKESTLSQIQTKGVRRGGLYGFFVKGEDIAGTIDDSSASAAGSSIPQSRTSTPATSASDTEAQAVSAQRSTKRSKRKRDGRALSDDTTKKARISQTQRDALKAVGMPMKSEHQDAVAKKLSKMKPKEKAQYEARAATKNQSLDEYVLRRIQKKAEQRVTKRAAESDR